MPLRASSSSFSDTTYHTDPNLWFMGLRISLRSSLFSSYSRLSTLFHSFLGGKLFKLFHSDQSAGRAYLRRSPCFFFVEFYWLTRSRSDWGVFPSSTNSTLSSYFILLSFQSSRFRSEPFSRAAFALNLVHRIYTIWERRAISWLVPKLQRLAQEGELLPLKEGQLLLPLDALWPFPSTYLAG